MFSLFPFCIACNLQSDDGAFNKDIQGVDPIEGVWELTKLYKANKWDTLYFEPDDFRVQHKIYLDGYVMWTADPSPDSSEWHGYGTYQFKNDTLIEKLLSMSLPMKARMGAEDKVILRIEYDKKFFKQATANVDNDTVYKLIEEWKKLN